MRSSISTARVRLRFKCTIPETIDKFITYFHFTLGFQKIEHLDMFPDLKCLYFEQNGTT